MSSIFSVKLPDIGEGVVEGQVIEWLKKVGDTVGQDEAVVVVMTDKATVELPSPHEGVLAKQCYHAGEIAKVGESIYEISVGSTVLVEQEILATPHTRHLADELGVKLESLHGSGKEGRITDEDVGKAAHVKDPEKAQEQRVPMIGVRYLVAEKMSEAKARIPDYSYFDSLDATRLIQLRNKIKSDAEKEGIKVSYMPFILRALSMTICRFPLLNSSVDFEKKEIIMHAQHDMGIAVSQEAGLIIAVLKNVEKMGMQEVVRSYDALMKKVQKGELSREERIRSTITVSNFGPLGGKWATPIINYPESAILGIAKIRKEPVVRGEEVVIRDQMNLSWTFDHRVIDGELAAKVSNYFIHLLENPMELYRR